MIYRALIPIAGIGRRLQPVSSAFCKAMLPLVDGSGRIRPVLHYILAEAAAAGIEEAALIVSPRDIEMVGRYLSAVGDDPDRWAPVLPRKIEFVRQDRPAGFGDAVARGAQFLAGEPFMLLLGDHVYLAEPGQKPCAAQVADALENRRAAAMVGVQAVSSEQLDRVGVVQGLPVDRRLYRCTGFIEKPTLAAANERLVTPGLGGGRFLAHCGIYIFAPEIFQCISAVADEARAEGSEIQLADAQSLLLHRRPKDYYLFHVAGRCFDVGTPDGYAAAFAAFAIRKNTT